MVIKLRILLLCLSLVCKGIYAQEKKKVSLEDVFKTPAFAQKTVQGINWMADGKYYSELSNKDGSKILKVNLASGESEEVLVDGAELGIQFSAYSFSADENFVLLISEVEPLYRRSTKAVFHILDRKSGKVQPLLAGEKVSYATLSPDNTKVAFVKNNNLFYKDLTSGRIIQVTYDGKTNEIINGAADWVYEEEFSMAKAFEWSPNGDKIAFIRFDESNVPVFNMQVWGELYPKDFLFKYPKAGEANANVSIQVFHLDTKKTTAIDTALKKTPTFPEFTGQGTMKPWLLSD